MGKLLTMLTGSVTQNLGETVKTVASIWKVDPAVVLENQTAVDKMANDLAIKTIDAASAQIVAVNATMQAEAKSEHFLQWSWRPCVGFTFCITILNNYVFMPHFAKLHPITIPSDVWNAMLIVLGVAAGTRGFEKIAKAQKSKKKAKS